MMGAPLGKVERPLKGKVDGGKRPDGSAILMASTEAARRPLVLGASPTPRS